MSNNAKNLKDPSIFLIPNANFSSFFFFFFLISKKDVYWKNCFMHIILLRSHWWDKHMVTIWSNSPINLPFRKAFLSSKQHCTYYTRKRIANCQQTRKQQCYTTIPNRKKNQTITSYKFTVELPKGSSQCNGDVSSESTLLPIFKVCVLNNSCTTQKLWS